MKRVVGWEVHNAYVDKGYQGNPKQLGSPHIHLANRHKMSMKPSEWRWFKRRSAIEPVIGHMKNDNRMDRNPLKGSDGDRMNAILAACGFSEKAPAGSLLAYSQRTGTAWNALTAVQNIGQSADNDDLKVNLGWRPSDFRSLKASNSNFSGTTRY